MSVESVFSSGHPEVVAVETAWRIAELVESRATKENAETREQVSGMSHSQTQVFLYDPQTMPALLTFIERTALAYCTEVTTNDHGATVKLRWPTISDGERPLWELLSELAEGRGPIAGIAARCDGVSRREAVAVIATALGVNFVEACS